MKENETLYPVPPQSVYVWRGFRNPDKSFEEFAGFLGSVFVPACALLQPNVGLRAYLPTLVPQENKPTAIPDQTALMFWANPAAHNLANTTVAVRAYQHLHGQLYDMSRSHTQEVPVILPSTFEAFASDQPYFLFDEEVDWMHGNVWHVIASRSKTVPSAEFQNKVFEWASTFQVSQKDAIDAALICCNEETALFWLHSTVVDIDEKYLSDLTDVVDMHLQIKPRQIDFGHGLWDNWSGINYSDQQNTSLNIRLARPKDPIPR